MSNEKGIPEFLSSDDISHTDNAVTLAKFRSISIQPEVSDVLATKPFSFGKGVESGGFSATESNLYSKARNSVFETATLSKPATLTCPERPYTLMRTNFELDPTKMGVSKDGKSKFEKIVETMNVCLNDFSEYDFTFFPPGDCMWKGKYLQGSQHCEIHVHIYTQSPNPAYIVEANRVEGDSKPFFAFFREFKALMLNVDDERPVNNFFFDPLPSSRITAEQFMGGIKPIFVMANEAYFESRLEAAKMLCDLSTHPEKSMLQLPECRKQCIECLEKLVRDDFEYVRQHATCAYSAFVDVPGYSEAMVNSTALQVFLGHVENPQEPAYETIQARRECSRILAALAKHNVGAVVANFKKFGAPVDEFLQRVDSLADQKLRSQASLLRDRLRDHLTQQKPSTPTAKK